jgi:hypothetical protein
MISDVLSEAIREIERYQKEFPQCYDEDRVLIDEVKAAMRRLQARYDDPCPRPIQRQRETN